MYEMPHASYALFFVSDLSFLFVDFLGQMAAQSNGRGAADASTALFLFRLPLP